MCIKRRKKIQFLAVFLFLIILIPNKVQAWDTNVAHPEIVGLGVEIYNQNFEQKLNTKELEWLKQGAMAEDTPLRWFNHFYDPVRNIGFKGIWNNLGDWAVSSNGQKDYALGDKSWYRAIEQYKNEDYENAFKSLGHVLHLVADASVPAHTRDDAHPEGDSLEQFVKYNWSELKKYLPKGEFKKVSNLFDAFSNSVKFSNSQFYSDDTIESNFYQKIEIKDYEEFNIEGEKFYFAKGLNNKKIFYTDKSFDWFSGNREISLKNYQILLDYSQHLLPQASGYTAGVIKLFFEEVEKDQEVKLSKSAKEGVFGWLNRQVGSVVTIVKELMGKNNFYEPIMMPVGAESGSEITASQASASSADKPYNDNTSTVIPTGVEESLKNERDLSTIARDDNVVTDDSDTTSTEVSGYGASNNIYLVSRVIDGDTFEIEINGQKQSVRLIGIDTPEKNKCFFTEAKEKAEELLLRKNVKLIKDTSTGDKDQYGRLLRYVYRESDNLFFNKVMISTGYAKEYNFKGQGYDFVQSFVKEEAVAKTNNLGLWSECYEKENENLQTIVTTTTYVYSGGGSDTATSQHNNITTITPTTTLDIIIPTSTPPDITPTTTGPNTGGGGTTISTSTPLNTTSSTPTVPVEDLTGQATTTSEIIDTTPPSIPAITIQNNSGFNSQEIIIITSSTDDYSENIYYDLDYSTNTLNWIIYLTSSTQNQFSFLGERGQEYYFRARAQDESGNISDWSENYETTITKINWSQDVVINEIAWAGASNNSNAEWIELYNNTNEDIDITNWYLEFSGKVINFKNTVNPIILAHGYYLLERTNDRSVIKMDADSFYTGALNNNGEKILLKNSYSEIIDEVNCINGWFAGESTNRYLSMERINSLISGNNQANWQSTQGERKAGPGHGGNMDIYGSPRTSNFGNIVLTNTQTEDLRILTKNNNPYILSSYTIPVNKTLQIESGVIIKSDTDKSRLKVYGNFNVLGTVEEKVIMTSGRDVSVQTDFIGDYIEDEPQTEDWVGLFFEDGSKGNISGLDFRYAGAKFWTGTFLGNFVYNAIILNNASLNISDSIFYKTGDHSINSLNSDLTVVRSEFDGGDQALYVKNSNLILSDLIIKNFTSLNSGPLEIYDNFPAMSNLVLEDNINNRIQLETIVLEKDETLTNNNNYAISVLEVPSATVFTIEAGVDIQMSAKGVIKVDGTLLAQGTANEKINIHPINNLNNWGHIEFNNSNSVLEHVNMFDGKYHSLTYASNNAMVIVNDSEVNFSDCILENIHEAGSVILSQNSSLTFTNCVIGEDEKYDGEPIMSSSYTTGINFKTGWLFLDHVEFKNLNVGFYGVGDLENFPIGSLDAVTFDNVDYWNLW